MKLKYSVLIQWSEIDQCYIASLPEWRSDVHTHGATYEEAASNAREALEMLAEDDKHRTLPPPDLFGYPEEDAPVTLQGEEQTNFAPGE
jgi:antitoxin HicB